MTQECTQGHTLDIGKDRCSRCNSPAVNNTPAEVPEVVAEPEVVEEAPAVEETAPVADEAPSEPTPEEVLNEASSPEGEKGDGDSEPEEK